MQLFIFKISFLFGLCYSTEYVPGTPGAAWSKLEVLTVKSKLYSVFANGGRDAVHQLTGLPMEVVRTMMPHSPVAKVIRLGFHDCIKYQDGTGGCDGCLNWEGVGFRYDNPVSGQWRWPNVGETNNNGLSWTVEILEGIYTDPNFPRVS